VQLSTTERVFRLYDDLFITEPRNKISIYLFQVVPHLIRSEVVSAPSIIAPVTRSSWLRDVYTWSSGSRASIGPYNNGNNALSVTRK